MAEPFLSEIRIMSFGFAPKGWALCNGQLLPINQNQGLFSLLGTTYGGEQGHTLSISEIPTHTHVANASETQATQGSGSTPTNTKILGFTRASFLYASPQSLAAMPPNEIGNTGGSQAHLNMQPFLVLNFCIALQGIFPSPN